MIKKIRILFVIENECFGGGEKTFSLLIRNLSPEKFEICCASRPEGRFYEETKGYCRFLPFDLSNRYDFANLGRLKKLMAENGIDLAHSQGARADFYCGLAAAAAGVRCLATIPMPVEGFDVGFLRRLLYRSLASLAARKISAVITVSSSLAVLLGKKHSRVELIPNPVDLAEFDPSNFNAVEFIKRFGLRGRLVTGALGRLEWQKGYSCLIEALALMFKKEPELRGKLTCLVAGGGRLAPDLKKRADSAGLSDNIVFCGETSSARDFLGALDIFLMPSLLEGQPLALLEAMAMGKAIVASDIPGIRETAAGGEEAVLVPPGDPHALAEAVLGLVHDPSLAAGLGRNARRKAETFSLSGFIERHETVYLSVYGMGKNA
ncbi:MAG: glycosyltransferase family 4 protein [Elusimicrobiales bacterium]|nr:glycosyltransferase family 4 protein [Elusimicrobiales bacterium]